MPANKYIMLDIRFPRLVVVDGNSGIDAGVSTTLMPFGQQENGSMKSQYSVDDCEVIRSLGEKSKEFNTKQTSKQSFT